MKNLYIAAVTLAITLSSQVSANDENRQRLGIGYSTTDAEVMGLSFGYGDGIKLEFGYDFNKYLSAHVSYEQNNESILRGDTLKLGGDAGYTFYRENVSIKPFISGGLYLYDENFYDDNGVYFGFGARASYKNFYVDVRQEFFDMEDQGVDVDIDQFSVTIGLKI
ncbi:porin family protein [Photobacterium sp. ZSDE20]|uniref:Porin family protein n=1 Tax=Photobacterium pectinilyticum TaxID=2906793 RepID=A0ABT1N8T8_9GAMM|nr:outer membrane beta-barrel protein [Photobacterium sp. ZSDE20]MCQ1061148.1 porin family protein [Photobacterium sp. ZSDE20]MDD1829333.1 porin family protein [Photobacterium sp. ZSDE20]